MKYEKINIKEFIRFFSDDSNKPVALFNLDGGLLQVNGPFREIIQTNQMNNIKEIFDKSTIDLWDEFIEIVKKTRRTTLYLPVQLTGKKANIIEIRLIYFEIANQVMAFFNVPQGYREKKESPYSKAFLKSENIMFILDHFENIHDINEECSKILNVSRGYFIGKSVEHLFYLSPDMYEPYKKHLKKAFADGHSDMFQRHVSASGEIKYYDITTYYDEENQLYLTRISDRTEKIKLEEQLAHRDRLSSVGQLAASIAHEIRNPMTSLKGFTQLLRISATEESKRYLTVIDDEIARMESILSEMLTLSKPSSNEKEMISLQKLLTSIIRVIYPIASSEGVTIIELENTLIEATIFGDAGKIRQVLLNLMKNALDAMPRGGVLTVGIDKSNDGGFTLSIADTGKGIDVNQLNQIFSPYFTTKTEGTGLGLPFVLKTIENHGGTISVESEINIGTKFLISFPPTIANIRGNIVDERVLTELGKH